MLEESDIRPRTRPALHVSIGLIALASAHCTPSGEEVHAGANVLRIHVPESDERELGPASAQYNWFFVFLGLADGSQHGEDPGPRLVDRWEHAADYSEWTLHVREGLQWDDGVPVTAKDVKFSLDLWTRPEVGYNFRHYDTIRVLDSQTLSVTFEQPVSATPWTFNWLPILPSHALEALDLDELFAWPFWVQPIGNGPFRYVRHVPQVMTELEANPGFYGPPPAVSNIVLQYGGSGVTELLGGTVDLATLITPIESMRLSGDPEFRVYHRAEYEQQVAIAWNHRRPLFQDMTVRRALTMSIDRAELHRLLDYPDDLAIFDVPARERHHVEGIVPDPVPFDRDAASRLLTAAGWVDGDGDGVLEKDGEDFQFTLLTFEETVSQAVYVQDQLRRVGIRMEIATHERSAVRARIIETDFDAVIDRYNYINRFGEFPITGYVNPEVSRLRDLVWFTIDQGDADRHLRELWQIVGAEMPITFLHPRVRYLAAHRRVRGLPNTNGRLPTDMPLPLLLEHVWIESDAGER